MANNFYFLYSLVPLLAGCTSGESQQVDSNNNENQYFSGGVSCSVSSDTSFQSSSTGGGVAESNSDVDCSADGDTNLPGPGVVSTGSGSVVFAGDERPVTGAMIDISYRDSNNDFMELDLTLHDGSVRTRLQQSTLDGVLSSRLDWGLYGASILVSAELRHQGSDVFTGGSFELITIEDGESPEDLNYASDVVVFVDKRADGRITAIDEVFKVISGNFNVSGSAPDWNVIVDVTLEDGSLMTGTYTGDFYEFPGL